MRRRIGAAVAHVVPGGIDERVHRVRLAPRGLAALRALAREEALVLVQRIAAAIRHEIFGQHDRQVLLRHGHRAAVVAVDDRDRRAPVALARNAPVAQAPAHLLLAAALRVRDPQRRHRRRPRNRARRTCRCSRRRRFPCRRTTAAMHRCRRRFAASLLANHLLDGQAVLASRTRNRARRAPGTPITAPSP